jgi:DNA-binding response OmpR family regulator
MEPADDDLRGRRVLIVEDDMLIAIMIEDMLLDLGCAALGPINTLPGALALATEEASIDLAILDIDLNGVPVFPVADVLQARGVPVVFSTGYGDTELPFRHRDCKVLHKPFRARNLAATVREALGKAG